MYLKKAMTGVAAVGLMAALFCGCGTNHKQMQSEHAEEHLEQIIIGSDSYLMKLLPLKLSNLLKTSSLV